MHIVTFMELDSLALQAEYHIVYFGRPVSRAWVPSTMVHVFDEDASPPEKEVGVLTYTDLSKAYGNFRFLLHACKFV